MTLLGRTFRALLPYGLYKHMYIIPEQRERARLEEERMRPAREERARILALTARNVDLQNIHAGKRCFILCNGPSVKRQDIRPLKGEIVFSVSSGYLHPDYAEIAPAYHCVPQITYTLMTRADVIVWFREMHERLGGAVTLFLNHTERALVREENLFPGRDVRYVDLAGPFSMYPPDALPDAAGEMPGAQSVPIMAALISMYMGHDRIYLLGADHDHFRSGEYKYFYEPTVLRGKDVSTDEHGKLRGGWHDELQGLAALWSQYRNLRQIAAANQIAIFNATAGGELDEFPRVTLESLFRDQTSTTAGSSD
ncbi:MAG: hypothetical protein J0H42_33995 [Rhizobiales bacterium]|nr:hypothetical protein [Hyphomicrobiales bacterium]